MYYDLHVYINKNCGHLKWNTLQLDSHRSGTQAEAKSWARQTDRQVDKQTDKKQIQTKYSDRQTDRHAYQFCFTSDLQGS